MSQRTWFTSDTHYQHTKAIELCKRPFKDVDDMNNGLIACHNAVVEEHDLVYHLGDFFVGGSREENAEILHLLNGQFYLIKGNHDSQAIDLAKKYPKKIIHVADMHGVKIKDEEVSHRFGGEEDNRGYVFIHLCHYPLADWNMRDKGSFHLHGHTHRNYSAPGKILDVGVDSNNFYPYSFEDIKTLLWSQPRPGNHHLND